MSKSRRLRGTQRRGFAATRASLQLYVFHLLAVESALELSVPVTCEKYALAAHRFLLAGPSRGAGVDFLRRNLVGIGHSLGGVAM